MTVYINGSKYEIEAVIKLFFPLLRFDFREEEPRYVTDSITAVCTDKLRVYANVCDREISREEELPADAADNEITL